MGITVSAQNHVSTATLLADRRIGDGPSRIRSLQEYRSAEGLGDASGDSYLFLENETRSKQDACGKFAELCIIARSCEFQFLYGFVFYSVLFDCFVM